MFWYPFRTVSLFPFKYYVLGNPLYRLQIVFLNLVQDLFYQLPWESGDLHDFLYQSGIASTSHRQVPPLWYPSLRIRSLDYFLMNFFQYLRPSFRQSLEQRFWNTPPLKSLIPSSFRKWSPFQTPAGPCFNNTNYDDAEIITATILAPFMS